MTRKPAVAGLFYESDFNKLEEQIKSAFLSKFGPGSFPSKEKEGKIKAMIVPHAGLSYSGPAAAFAYKALAESNLPSTFVLIGPNHTGMGYDSILMEDMRTPFGDVQIDVDLAKEIVENTPLVADDMAHLKEHSLEVQLPFLQMIVGKELKIVPIVLGMPDTKRIAESLKKVLENKDVCIIVSSDFVHYGYNYDYVPFKENIRENITKMGEKAFEFIKSLDAEGFKNFVEGTGATICGRYPIELLLRLMEKESVEVELLAHYNSGDISGDYSNCVDYMGIIMKEKSY